MSEKTYPVYGEITGPIVMIGFGSIGRGTLPLIERHFKFDKSRMVVIDPRNDEAELLAKHGIKHIQSHVTKENYKKLLKPLTLPKKQLKKLLTKASRPRLHQSSRNRSTLKNPTLSGFFVRADYCLACSAGVAGAASVDGAASSAAFCCASA